MDIFCHNFNELPQLSIPKYNYSVSQKIIKGFYLNQNLNNKVDMLSFKGDFFLLVI